MMHTTQRLLTLTCVLGMSAAASASLVNPGFELTTEAPPAGFGWNGLIVGWDQPTDGVPGGARYADVGARTIPAGMTPGTYFVYTNATAQYRFGEETSTVYSPGMTYSFTGYGTENATHQLSIGYLNDSGDYVPLNDSAATATDNTAWAALAPAEWTTGATGEELGRNVVVYYGGPLVNGGSIWVDDFSLTVVPEPGSIALIGLGGMALLRRRRTA